MEIRRKKSFALYASQAMNTTNPMTENSYIFCGIPRVLFNDMINNVDRLSYPMLSGCIPWTSNSKLNFSLYLFTSYGVEGILRDKWQTSISLKDNWTGLPRVKRYTNSARRVSCNPSHTLLGELSMLHSCNYKFRGYNNNGNFTHTPTSFTIVFDHGWITRKEWIATCKR